MTNYWDKCFLEKLDKEYFNTSFKQIIFEVGSRYGDETLELSKHFPHANLYSFECNPNTIDICMKKLNNKKNITFLPVGLGANNEKLPFYSYTQNNDGASSFLKRIDYNSTQKNTGEVNIRTIYNIMNEYKLDYIDLLCMDVQGFELNVLKGAGDYISKIRYIIMEEPKPIINELYLPKNTYSKYINAPSSQEIKEFMNTHNFIEIERINENMIEDNVMYRNTLM